MESSEISTESTTSDDNEFFTSSTTEEYSTTNFFTEIFESSDMPSSIMNDDFIDENAMIRFTVIDYIVFGIMLAMSGDF